MSGIAVTVAQGHEAVPLRAVPFLTGGAIDGVLLMEFVVRESSESNLAGYPPLQLLRLAGTGDAALVEPGEVFRHLSDMQADRAITRELQRERIPAGLWVWKDQLRALYCSVALDFAWPHEGRMVGFRGHWCETPLLNTAEHAYIYESLVEQSKPAAAKCSRSKFQVNGLDISLRESAVATALELTRRSHGRRATRRKVAQEMAVKLNMPAGTVERRISAKWW